jgi:hypothetical protein
MIMVRRAPLRLIVNLQAALAPAISATSGPSLLQSETVAVVQSSHEQSESLIAVDLGHIRLIRAMIGLRFEWNLLGMSGETEAHPSGSSRVMLRAVMRRLVLGTVLETLLRTCRLHGPESTLIMGV